MDKLILQPSKIGDIIGVIPIAYAAHLRGERYGIMACSEFASVLDGISYADKIVFEGKPWQLKEAYEQAKKLCDNVVVTAVNGPIDVIQKYAYEPAGQPGAVTDSFCRESFKLADQNYLPPHLHIQAFVTAKMTKPDGSTREGCGILEQLIAGPHAPSGFKDVLDPAKG